MKRIHLVLFIGLLLAANVATAQEAKKDASIVGDWKGEKATRGGKDRPVPEGGIIFTFSADGKMIVKEGDREGNDAGGYKVDAKKNPAEIDIIAPKEKGTLLGIYKLEGDTLTLCISGDKDSARPSKFESPEGSRLMLMTFKRVRK